MHNEVRHFYAKMWWVFNFLGFPLCVGVLPTRVLLRRTYHMPKIRRYIRRDSIFILHHEKSLTDDILGIHVFKCRCATAVVSSALLTGSACLG